jgi:cytochrome P450
MRNNMTANTTHIQRLEALIDASDMVNNPVQIFEKYRLKSSPTFMFHFGGVRKTIVSSDPMFIQHVLKDNPNNYEKSDIQVKRMAEFQEKGLLNSHGDFWFRQRRLLSQGFTRSYLTKLLPIQVTVLDQFMKNLNDQVQNGPVDIYQQMVNLTLRLVGKSLFGNEMQEKELDRIGDAISEIQSFMVRQIVQPYKIPWFRISGQTAHYQKIRIDADRIVSDYISKRKQDGSAGNDMLNLLMTTPAKDTGEIMSDDQLMIEILQLLVAGNETSSNTLAWTFYLLARHPECQAKVRAEIRDTIGDDELDFIGLHKLSYTLQVIDEATRLYPPFWMIDRVALKDDEAAGIHIPAGVMVVPYIYGAHHNEMIWDNPEKFDPDRFEPAKAKARHPFAHVPFGGGPRVCIGQNMAIMQILLILATIVRKYDFSMVSDEVVPINPMMILRPGTAIKMNFKSL